VRARVAAQLRFYGWRVVLFAALGLALTAPGQTVGVSVFVDEIIVALDLTRSQVSTAYLVGTLTGALTMPVFGRAIDRYGVRIVMAGIGVAFGAALVGMSAVTGLASLVVGFTGIRMLGQGALGLTSTTSVALWFERRRGLALGLTVAVGGALISVTPIVLTRVIGALGWRASWVVTGIAVGSAVVAIALLGMRNRPEDVGQRVDGDAPDPDGAPPPERWGWTRAEASRTLMFWAITAGVSTVGLIGTGMQFHQISLLTGQGLSTTAAAANFVPQTVATIVATIGVGALVDRLDPRWLVIGSMAALATAMLLVPVVAPGALAIVYALCLGAAGGSIRSLEASAFPRFFGTAHIGSIRGTVMAVNVGGTAFGPLALASGAELTGSYAEVLSWLIVLPLAVAVLALVARPPTRGRLAVLRGEVAAPVSG